MQPRVDPTTQSLAIDANSLNSLKRANNDSPEAIRAVARQFEAVLMNMMLKSMRETVPQDGITDSEQGKMFMGMLDQQLSTNLSQKGMGLTDVLVRQLSKFSQKPGDVTDGSKDSKSSGKLDSSAALPHTSQTNQLTSNSNGKAVLAQAAQKNPRGLPAVGSH